MIKKSVLKDVSVGNQRVPRTIAIEKIGGAITVAGIPVHPLSYMRPESLDPILEFITSTLRSMGHSVNAFAVYEEEDKLIIYVPMKEAENEYYRNRVLTAFGIE